MKREDGKVEMKAKGGEREKRIEREIAQEKKDRDRQKAYEGKKQRDETGNQIILIILLLLI